MNLQRLMKLGIRSNRYAKPSFASTNANFSILATNQKENESTEKIVKVSDVEIKPKLIIDKVTRELKPSFAKQLFLGRFDTDVLTYPEVLSKDEHETLHEMVHLVEKYFEDKVDSKQIDAQAKIPSDVLQGVKDLGLFGQQIPTHLGGLGLNATSYARVAEAISDGSIAVTLAAHQAIGLKGVLMYGTDAQKKKYLPRLANGEWIAAFCLTEPGAGSDAASIKTSARLSSDGKHWILKGSKIWISNGGIADFFTVFASTDDSVDKSSSKRITAFVVERSFGGITSGKPEDKLGIRGSNTTEVHFDSTPVPIENVIGEVGQGFKIAVNILNSGRFSMGSSGAGSLRKLLKITAEHAIERRQFGKSLSEFDLIKHKISQVAVNTYIMESMAYLTAGMLDSNSYEDCALEAAIVKVFSSEACWTSASECLQILGGLGYMKDVPYERILRDSRIMLIFEGTNEILRLFIALMGFQYAGKNLRETIKKLRNPFMFPNVIWRKSMERWHHTRDKPKLTLALNNFLHPSLKDASVRLEYSVLRLQYVVELLLQKHGTKITEAQLDLEKVANIVIDIYAMTAVLSRASRSYCTGIRNAYDEIAMAEVVTMEAESRVKSNVSHLQGSMFLTTDVHHLKIAQKVFASKGYFLEHPLVRNIW